MDKNTQQPVAWVVYNGWRKELPFLTEEAARDFVAAEQLHADLSGNLAAYRIAPTYTAPPVPRDVLMAAMRDAVADMKAGAFLADCGTDIAFHAVDYAAIADRYASQVQAVDKGPWRHGIAKGITKVRVFIESDDFTHDVRLYVDGDFADTAERVAYAKGIAKQLNAAQQPASAQPMSVPDEWHQFVKDISQQEPEKPDYWNSCGQCARNIDRAEDLIDAAQGNLDLNVPDEVMKDAARWKIIKQLASEDGGHALSILVMYCGLTECDTDALDAAIDKVIAENTAAQKPEGGE